MRNNEEERLLQRIDQYSFAMDDTRLFLDTHPDDANAMAYFQKLAALRKKAIAEYTLRFGQLDGYCESNTSDWRWNTSPYPWEVE